MKNLFLILALSFSINAHADGCYTPSGEYWDSESFELNNFCTKEIEFGTEMCVGFYPNHEGGLDYYDYLNNFINAYVYTCFVPTTHEEFVCRLPVSHIYCP